MKIQIEVTAKDIETGQQCDCQNCPVALALQRVLKDGYTGQAYTNSVRIIYVDQWNLWRGESFSLPEKVVRFISLFDAGAVNSEYEIVELQPFTFELDLPKEYLNENQKAN